MRKTYHFVYLQYNVRIGLQAIHMQHEDILYTEFADNEIFMIDFCHLGVATF
jgi:hypothetical protein